MVQTTPPPKPPPPLPNENRSGIITSSSVWNASSDTEGPPLYGGPLNGTLQASSWDVSRSGDSPGAGVGNALPGHQEEEEEVEQQQQETDEDYCGGGSEVSSTSLPDFTGEFDWDKATRSRVLSMYFYGYIVTQIPGGWLAGRYGGRKVWGVCQLVSAVSCLLTPLAARSSVSLLMAVRVLIGLAHGVSFPCVHAMMGRWAPRLERTKLVSFAFAGPPIGTILTFSLSALLCSYGFDNGWGSIFYLAGAGNLLWVVTWWFFTSDTPSEHTSISEKERNYILESIGETPDSKERVSTPWRAMMTSGPLWAIILAHMCNNYTNYTLLTSLPTFMKEVQKFDIKQNGALSSLPYLSQAVSSVIFGNLADCLRERNILSTKNTRKILQVTSFLGVAACMAAAGFMTCEQRPLSVVIICLCLAFLGLNRAGYTVNHIDLAPRHAGVLFGITNTAGTIPGLIAPMVAGALTPNKSAEEWRHVFYICAATAVLGAVTFGALADGELQSWASPPARQLVIAADDTHRRRDEKPSDDVNDDATQPEAAEEEKAVLAKLLPELKDTTGVTEGGDGLANAADVTRRDEKPNDDVIDDAKPEAVEGENVVLAKLLPDTTGVTEGGDGDVDVDVEKPSDDVIDDAKPEAAEEKAVLAKLLPE